MPLSHSVYVVLISSIVQCTMYNGRYQNVYNFRIMRAGKVIAEGKMIVPQSKLLSIQ